MIKKLGIKSGQCCVCGTSSGTAVCTDCITRNDISWKEKYDLVIDKKADKDGK